MTYVNSSGNLVCSSKKYSDLNRLKTYDRPGTTIQDSLQLAATGKAKLKPQHIRGLYDAYSRAVAGLSSLNDDIYIAPDLNNGNLFDIVYQPDLTDEETYFSLYSNVVAFDLYITATNYIGKIVYLDSTQVSDSKYKAVEIEVSGTTPSFGVIGRLSLLSKATSTIYATTDA